MSRFVHLKVTNKQKSYVQIVHLKVTNMQTGKNPKLYIKTKISNQINICKV